MARHLAPFSCRQTIAEMVRRRSFGCVLPLGRHASTNGSKLIHCASDSIALSSFQEGQNARHHNRFKREHALAILTGLTLKAVFRLAYRQTEGLIGSVIGLLGLDLAVPDHSTLCRRAETL